MSVVVGCVVSVLCAVITLVLSSYDLRREAKKLREMSALMMRAMEEKDFAGFTRDEKGVPHGLKRELRLSSNGSSKTAIQVRSRVNADLAVSKQLN